MNPKSIIKVIKYLIYALVIIVPLIFFKTGMYPFQVIKTVVFQSLVEIIFVLWLALIIFYKEYRPRLTLLAAAVGIFMIVMAAASIISVDRQISFWSSEARTLGFVALLHFAVLFLVLVSLKENIDWKNIWMFSFVAAVLVSLVAIAQRFALFPSDSVLYIYSRNASGIRAFGTFGNSSFMAGYLLFNFFIGLYLFAKRKTLINTDSKLIYADKKSTLISSNLYKSVFFITGTILMGVAILLSQTLGVVLGLGIGIFTLLLFFSLRKSQPALLRSISVALLALIIILAGIFWLTRENGFWQKIPGVGRMATTTLESSSVRDRLITWNIAWNAFKKKPVLGWGFENFRLAFNENYNPKILTDNVGGTYWDKPHNVFFEYLVNTGIIGFLSYLFVFISAFYLLLKKPQIAADKEPMAADYQRKSATISGNQFIAAAIIAYLAQNFFLFDTIGTYLMFFLVLAYINSQYKPTRINADEERIYADKESVSIRKNSYQSAVIIGLLLISLFPIYYNIQIFNASRDEYWGVNYFLNLLPESSLVFFSRAVEANGPYKDDIIKTFAGTVKQAEQQGVSYPNIAQLQVKLVDYLNGVIDRHPKEFFNYLTMAEFLNVFYKYNPSYLDDAQKMGEEALALSPQRQQVYYALAKTQLLKGNVRGAYEIFKKVLELNPEAADPHFFFGILAYGVGDSKTGVLEIAKAEELGRFPRKPEEAIALGNFVGDYNGNYKKAIEYYKMAMNLAEQNFIGRSNDQYRQSILLKLGVAYYFDGNLEQSKKSFLEFQKTNDFKTLPIYPDLKPVLIELGVEN